MIENTNVDLRDGKRSALNDAFLGKDERRGFENFKSVVCQLGGNRTEQWNEHQNKKDRLDSIKNQRVCFNVETDDLLIERIESSERSDLIELNEKNMDKSDECLKDKNIREFILKDQNQDYIEGFEQTSEEPVKTNQKLIELIDQLDRVDKEETLKLDYLLKRLGMGEKYGSDLNQTIFQQKIQNQDLSEVLEKCNQKIDVIKQTIDKSNVESENRIDVLRGERLNVEEERISLEKELKKCEKELEQLGHQNERLNTDVNKLQCKLDGVVKNSDEKHKLLTKTVKTNLADNKQLMAEIDSKKQLIVRLEAKLSETRKTHKTEAENVHNLKIKLDNLKHKRNIIMSPVIKCGDHNKYDPQTSRVNKVLDDFKSDSENIILTTPKERTGRCPDDFEDSDQEIEDLIKTCKSLVNDFNKK